MKKQILTMLLLAVSVMGAKADDRGALKIAVTTDNSHSYNIAETQKMKHEDGKLVMFAHNVAMGSYEIYDGMKITFERDAASGNANVDTDESGNDMVTMADANLVVNYFLSGTATNFNVTAADSNKDGGITMADANAIVNIFLGN